MTFCGRCGIEGSPEDLYCVGCGRQLRRGIEDHPVSEERDVEDSSLAIEQVAVSQRRHRDASEPVESLDDVLKLLRLQIGLHLRTIHEQASIDIVFPGSAASSADLRSSDVIVGVGPVPVETLNQFIDAIRDIDLAKYFTIDVERGDEKLVLLVDPLFKPALESSFDNRIGNSEEDRGSRAFSMERVNGSRMVSNPSGWRSSAGKTSLSLYFASIICLAACYELSTITRIDLVTAQTSSPYLPLGIVFGLASLVIYFVARVLARQRLKK